MNWVMGKAFPDDMPLEAKMVTKAIERAQHTVEARNFEIRKDVLKYDEVMNEQRKVIYRRRQQILDGGDLRDETFNAITATVERIVEVNCPGEYPEEWDLDELYRQIQATYPTRVTREQLDACTHRDAVLELLVGDAVELYEAKEATVGAEDLREIERRVMLSMIDQHWRGHLYEMDYLREGINLAYVSHVQVAAVQEAPRAPSLSQVRYSAAEDPVQGASAMRATAATMAPDELTGGELVGSGLMDATAENEAPTQAPIRVEKTPGRNDPCFCGSGKKFKLCHGR